MKYRRIVDGEPQFGHSQKDFAQGIEAVGQAVLTRLKLFTNEWWEDLEDGLPVWTQMLSKGGHTNKDKLTLLITNRIVNTKLEDLSLISGMSNVVGTFDGTIRKYTYLGTAQSIYGEITITNS